MKKDVNIGQKIKNRRLALNLTMDTLAKKSGITRATLSSLENGSYNCSLKTVLKILKILDMEIEIGSKELLKGNRLRATRTNTVLEKNINKFIVFCIEQYAKSIETDSTKIYEKMKNKGVIKELHDDYEDLHGMSSSYLNYYISKLMI